MKKFLAVMMVACALVVVGSLDNQAGAEPKAIDSVFVGYYPDGAAAYLLTDSIRGGRSNFTCTAVDSRGSYVRYNFYYANGGPYYTNNWGASAYVYGSGSQVAAGIWNWVQRYY